MIRPTHDRPDDSPDPRLAAGATFDEREREAVYRVIHERRDIRAYRPEPVPDDVLWRILDAAHHAPSVGFMQPWNFLLVEDPDVRRQVYEHFRDVNDRAANHYDDDRALRYRSLKLQGILDAPLNVVVTCDPTRGGKHVLGRATIRETDEYSTCLAVQNLWLAARAEGVGVGWMSLMEPPVVRALLGIPEHVVIVAYLTVGYPVSFPPSPLLEKVGWEKRRALAPLVFRDRWACADERVARQLPLPGSAPGGAQERDAGSEPGAGGGATAVLRERNAELTKPPGSLGVIEETGLRLAALQGGFPRTARRTLLILAGDHGVTEEAVSAYRPEVTARMVYQFLADGAAINALARQHRFGLQVVDLGVAHDFAGARGVVDRKVVSGTRNLRREDALTAAERDSAIEHGRALVRALGDQDVLLVGEMGIGNTTSASALCAALLGMAPDAAVGRGTGVGSATLRRKASVVRDALARVRGGGGAVDSRGSGSGATDGDRALTLLAALGGAEIAGLVGVLLEASARRTPVLLDGFTTGVAALVARAIDPRVQDVLFAGHLSAEPAHAAVLEALALEPLLRLGMRLGEGSGAAMALPLLDSAARILTEMRTFEEANIEHPTDPRGAR